MQVSATNVAPSNSTSSLPANQGVNSKVPTNWKKIALVALVVLGVGLMVAGTGVGVGGLCAGVYFLGKAYLASAIGAKIFAVTAGVLWPLGSVFGYVSLGLLTNPVTALGAVFTGPAAGICFGLPLLPALLGAVGGLPGVAIGYGGYKLYKMGRAPALAERRQEAKVKIIKNVQYGFMIDCYKATAKQILEKHQDIYNSKECNISEIKKQLVENKEKIKVIVLDAFNSKNQQTKTLSTNYEFEAQRESWKKLDKWYSRSYKIEAHEVVYLFDEEQMLRAEEAAKKKGTFEFSWKIFPDVKNDESYSTVNELTTFIDNDLGQPDSVVLAFIAKEIVRLRGLGN